MHAADFLHDLKVNLLIKIVVKQKNANFKIYSYFPDRNTIG